MSTYLPIERLLSTSAQVQKVPQKGTLIVSKHIGHVHEKRSSSGPILPAQNPALPALTRAVCIHARESLLPKGTQAEGEERQSRCTPLLYALRGSEQK